MISLESSDARDRIGEIRDGLRRAMRHLSKPGPDWGAASVVLLCVSIAALMLSKDCQMEEVEHGKSDR